MRLSEYVRRKGACPPRLRTHGTPQSARGGSLRFRLDDVTVLGNLLDLVIVSFRDKRTKQVYGGKLPKGFPEDLFRRSVVKLDQLQSAAILEDLMIPPSNRLEALSGDRSGQHSIRINNQWRICFIWKDGNAHEVEIIDYH